MERISRRAFLKAAGAAAAVPGIAAEAATPARTNAAHAPVAYTFFNPQEASFMEAAVERLIPADELGPGAREANVAFFIDRQLAGAWGAGARLYRAGPFAQGTPSQGYQLPFTPAELFRHALRAIHEDLARRGTPFEEMAARQQDDYLKSLQDGTGELGGVPSKTFFESLLELTLEGYFSDPVYGGNKDMASWEMIGFPGAYADYYQLVDRHGIAYRRKPMSLAENGRGQIHVHRGPAKKAEL